MEMLNKVFSPLRSSREPVYRQASQDANDDESLLPRDQEHAGEKVTNGHIATRNAWPTWIKLLVFFILFSVYSVLLVICVQRRCSDIECGKRVSLWSPMNEAIEYVEFDFETEFDQETKYRGPPSPQLDNAWESILELNPVPFPEDKLPLVNRTNGMRNGDMLARMDGDNSPVAANFEVFHQLHCLNYIRQYTWRDWYFRHSDEVVIPSDMLASDVAVRMHADHCIDLLRTSLMCHGDTTPFFTIVDPEQPLGAKGDFSAHHKCRNFEKLLAWTKENSEVFQSSEEQHGM